MLQMFTNPVSFIGYLYRVAIHLLCACWCQDTRSVYNNHMMMLSMVYCAIGTYPITQWITFLWRFILAYKCRLRPQKLYTSALPRWQNFNIPANGWAPSTAELGPSFHFSRRRRATASKYRVPGGLDSTGGGIVAGSMMGAAPLTSKELLNVQPPRSQASTPSFCRLQYEKRGAAEIYIYRR